MHLYCMKIIVCTSTTTICHQYQLCLNLNYTTLQSVRYKMTILPTLICHSEPSHVYQAIFMKITSAYLIAKKKTFTDCNTLNPRIGDTPHMFMFIQSIKKKGLSATIYWKNSIVRLAKYMMKKHFQKLFQIIPGYWRNNAPL